MTYDARLGLLADHDAGRGLAHLAEGCGHRTQVLWHPAARPVSAPPVCTGCHLGRLRADG